MRPLKRGSQLSSVKSAIVLVRLSALRRLWWIQALLRSHRSLISLRRQHRSFSHRDKTCSNRCQVVKKVLAEESGASQALQSYRVSCSWCRTCNRRWCKTCKRSSRRSNNSSMQSFNVSDANSRHQNPKKLSLQSRLRRCRCAPPLPPHNVQRDGALRTAECAVRCLNI
eukprot:SAG11_NODE_86_length_17300_cov_11.466717_17_plen_169_part_00